MSHRMTGAKYAFVRILNRKGHVEALSGYIPASVVSVNMLFVYCPGNNFDEASYFALNNVFADPTMQIAACPLDFNINYSI